MKECPLCKSKLHDYEMQCSCGYSFMVADAQSSSPDLAEAEKRIEEQIANPPKIPQPIPAPAPAPAPVQQMPQMQQATAPQYPTYRSVHVPVWVKILVFFCPPLGWCIMTGLIANGDDKKAWNILGISLLPTILSIIAVIAGVIYLISELH